MTALHQFGYLSAALVVSALVTWGIALTGPLLADTASHGARRARYRGWP